MKTMAKRAASSSTIAARAFGRGAHLGLGYVAATLSGALVAAVSMTALTYSISAASLSVDILFGEANGAGIFAGLLFALSLPVAWAPLSISLPVFRLRLERLPACLASGALTGAALTAWFVWLGSIVPSFGTEDDPSPLWRSVLLALPFGVTFGIVGGFVLWIVCFRGTPRHDGSRETDR